MVEIRLHGRGGQGLVKASHLVVRTAVETGKCAQFIPFFGVERKGSPVFGFLRLSEEPIRRRTQVYEPDVLIILDDTLLRLPAVLEGLKPGGAVIVNTAHPVGELELPETAAKVVTVDASGICMELLGRNIPNTAMLGAFARATGLVDRERLFENIAAEFGEANRAAAERAYELARSVKGDE